jgi:hypothetical protein
LLQETYEGLFFREVLHIGISNVDKTRSVNLLVVLNEGPLDFFPENLIFVTRLCQVDSYNLKPIVLKKGILLGDNVFTNDLPNLWRLVVEDAIFYQI